LPEVGVGADVGVGFVTVEAIGDVVREVVGSTFGVSVGVIVGKGVVVGDAVSGGIIVIAAD